MWLVLQETLADTPYADRLASSERIVNALRGRKSPAEIERIREAVRETEEIFEVVNGILAPGLTELEIAAVMHDEVKRRGLGYAWEPVHCPAVNGGPDKEVGHSSPSELRTKRGELLHTDFGVSKADYCSDLQRVWYLLDEGETEAPPDVVQSVGRGLGGGRRRRRGAATGRGRLAGRRSGSIAPRRGRLPGADVLARPPARPVGA